jgi:LysR family transcriptional regulator, flagellar master operon regulator
LAQYGLVDLAFCYAPQSGENFASRVLFDDELVLVSSGENASAELDQSYVYVDYGDAFRRQHAAAFPADTTSAIIIASADWAVDHLLRRGGSGYLPRRHVTGLLAAGRLHLVRGAPAFKRRVYVVENAPTVRNWAWWGDAVESIVPKDDRPASLPAADRL